MLSMEQISHQAAAMVGRRPASRTSSRGSKSPRTASRAASVQSLSAGMSHGASSAGSRRRVAGGKGAARFAAKGDQLLQQQRQREHLAAQAEAAAMHQRARVRGGKAPRTGGKAPRMGGKAPRTGGKAPRTGGKAPRGPYGGKAPRSNFGGKAPRSGGNAAHLRTLSAPVDPSPAPKAKFGRALSADAVDDEKKQYPRNCPNPECDKVFASSAGYVVMAGWEGKGWGKESGGRLWERSRRLGSCEPLLSSFSRPRRDCSRCSVLIAFFPNSGSL